MTPPPFPFIAGRRALVSLGPGGARTQFFDDQPPTTWVEAQVGQNRDVYFTPGLFKEPTARTKANSDGADLFWLDLDVGQDDPKKYPSKMEAMEHAFGTLHGVGIPYPTVVINSGWGVHAYWQLTRVVPPGEWVPLAEAFKTLCHQHGVKADPARTADLASIMRLPGTVNFKREPQPTEVIWDRETEDDAILDVLARHPTPTAAPAQPVQRAELPLANAQIVADRCHHMRTMRDTKGVMPEPLWRACISVLSRCVDGRELAHDWSKGDERYNPKEVDDKFDRALGPATCDHFRGLDPATCQSCNEFVNSPIMAAPAPRLNITPLVTPPPAMVATHPPQMSAPQFVIDSWSCSPDGVQHRPKPDEEWVIISKLPLWVVDVTERDRLPHEHDNSTLLIAWKAPGKEVKTANLPQTKLYDEKGFTAWLAAYNIRAMVFDTRKLMSYIANLTREAITGMKVRTLYTRVGWTGGGIVFGGKLFTPAGPREVQMSTDLPLLRAKQTGDPKLWAETSAIFNDHPLHAAPLLASIGSVILGAVQTALDMPRFSGAMLSLVGKGGAGKSMSAKFGLSFWADPEVMSHSATSSINFYRRALETHRNFPHLLDEVGKLTPQMLGSLVYDAVNGEGRSVLTNARDQVEAGTWALVPIVTTNRAILDFGQEVINEAQRLRVIELNIYEELTQAEWLKVVHCMSNHRGGAGEVFLTQLVRHLGELPALWGMADERIKQWGDLPLPARFQRWTMQAMFIGGWLAQRWGLLQVDTEKVMRAVYDQLVPKNADTDSEQTRIAEALVEFLTEFNSSVLRWPVGSAMPTNHPNNILARYDSKTQTLMISTRQFRALCLAAQIPIDPARAFLKERGMKETPTVLEMGTPPLRCLVIPLANLGVALDQPTLTKQPY